MHALNHELTVACRPDQAYELFTTGMGRWWDPALTPDPAAFTGIEVVGEVGGEAAVLLGTLRQVVGEVTVWEPAEHYVLRFWLAMSPEHPTSLDVRFAAVDGVCTLHLRHGGWTAANRDARITYDAWPALLGRFARVAAALN